LIVLPDGGELVTLLDAGLYIESLPEVLHRRQEWHIATEMLLAVADGRWPVTFRKLDQQFGLAFYQDDIFPAREVSRRRLVI
jgi:hypothetical protein